MTLTVRHLCGAALVALAVLRMVAPVAAQAPSPIGRWRTIDDKTGDTKSIVEIRDTPSGLEGVVVKVFSPPAPSPNPLCDECSGERKGKPILGMQIMWGLRKNGAEYIGGRVFDPNNGKTYRGKIMVLVEDELDGLFSSGRRLLADPAADMPIRDAVRGSTDDRILLAIGPEGGWNEFERTALATHGFQTVGMGPRTLRTDTACIALLALVHDAM